MGKKRLAVVTIEKDARDEYVRQLKHLFSDYLEITGYSVREKINGKIDADLILISAAIATSIVKPHLPPGVENLYIDIMFSKDRVGQLKEIPAGTRAMLVDYSYSTAIDIISILHEVGVKHINFKPVYLDIKENDIPDADIAVTAGLLPYVPPRATKIIDIGYRQIGITTLMDIAIKLHFLDAKVQQQLLSFSSELLPASNGLTTILKSSNQIKNQLEIVLEIIDEGIAVVDENNTFVHCNNNLCRFLNIEEGSLTNKRLESVQIDTSLYKEIIKAGVVENRLLEVGDLGKKYVLTKRQIQYPGKQSGNIIIVQDVTQIENLESQLREQLCKRGHVAKYFFEDIIGQSPDMLTCIEKAKKIATKDATVLITGETGTGKELFAQSIHNYSARKNRSFIAINCAALPSNLLESELFGYEKGAFTGAQKEGKRGLLELAHNGTLLLDEVGDIPLEVQRKLLRVLEEREVMRIGGINIIPINVRIIAATNLDLKELIQRGKFRKDLYYRLNVLGLHLPPLRNRISDIPYLIQQILGNIGCSSKKIDSELMRTLEKCQWDGNVRELKNCVEYMGYMGGPELTVLDLPESFSIGVSDEPDKKMFHELLPKENKICEAILRILSFRNAGRRLLLRLLHEQGFDITEYEIRKNLHYLQQKNLVHFGKGKTGVSLTSRGQKLVV